MRRLFLILLISSLSEATRTDLWEEGRLVEDAEARKNIYSWDPNVFQEKKKKGLVHSLRYPVKSTGVAAPFEPFLNFLINDNPLKDALEDASGREFPFSNLKEFFDWLGLAHYPETEESGIYNIKRPMGVPEDFRVGASIIDADIGSGLTFSCTACHASNLFGRTVIGLPNKFERSNKLYKLYEDYLPIMTPALFQLATGATDEETRTYRNSRRNIQAVASKVPLAWGLNTPYSHVGRSLAKRARDPWAQKSSFRELFPRRHQLDKAPADSKPGTWWNMKYKNRMLSDGSVLSGNPVLTNILWNEIGRGADLKKLDQWVEDNEEIIEELTTFVYSTEAPLWTDFFGEEKLNLASAQRGEMLFNSNCTQCHGIYEKNWSRPDAETLSFVELVKTSKVIYHQDTPVKNVGTDPHTFQGKKELAEQMNRLAISKKWDIKIVPQEGYVPPPLEGIWARYPYFHNNSAPSLCAVLTPASKRPMEYYHGPADNIETDFDSDCVGYPLGDDVPEGWADLEDSYYDLSLPGLRNTGHSKMLLDEEGKEKFSAQQKQDLVEYLKTL